MSNYYKDIFISDTDDRSDNIFILFERIIKSVLKDNTEYDITMLDNDIELFKMTGGDGVSSFPYKQFDKINDFLFQKSKFIQEKKDELYNSLFKIENEYASNSLPHTTPIIHATIPPFADIITNTNNTQNIIITQNKPNQLGEYNKINNNVITVKLTIYSSNNYENSFIKKLRYSQ